jgi:hypothetical protein
MKTELKTIVGLLVAAAIGLVVAILNAVQDSPGILGALPTWLQSLLLVAIPIVLQWIAQYQAPHTVRADEVAQRRAAKVGLKVVPLDQIAA